MNIIKLTENTEVRLHYVNFHYVRYKPLASTKLLPDINGNKMRTNLPEMYCLPEQVDNTNCHVARTQMLVELQQLMMSRHWFTSST